MKLYAFERAQRLPIDIETSWKFFSNPGNLKEITPPWLNLRMTAELPDEIYTGLLIPYQVHPLLGIPFTWVTEITHVEKPELFVDEQRFGPYRFWHHRHLFKEIKGGIEMTDMVSYALRFDPFSRILNALMVRRKLDEIFRFRFEYLQKKFGALPSRL
ncbi:MAG: SRPBCC family protein [Candidatus Zixiibacteriota bacterium]|jgi:ligand-binding SRPBCC domain-containing protein